MRRRTSGAPHEPSSESKLSGYRRRQVFYSPPACRRLQTKAPGPAKLPNTCVGSLACMGLGYWVVLDPIGAAVPMSKFLPVYLHRPTPNASIGRLFGCVARTVWFLLFANVCRTRRLETVVVYLMYVFRRIIVQGDHRTRFTLRAKATTIIQATKMLRHSGQFTC